jgi:hypothetical protein
MLLTPLEFDLTVQRAEKINDRAIKRGFTGRIIVVGEQVTRTETGPTGINVTKHYVDTTITGNPPSYGGWVFAASLDFTEAGAVIVNKAPGAPSIDRDVLKPGWCGHCETNRRRTATYVVINPGTGEQKQVGSTCVQDFTGWAGKPVFIPEGKELTEELFGGFGYGEQVFDVETVLHVAWAAIKTFGFTPTSSFERTPTRNVVKGVLTFDKAYTEDAAAMMGNYTDATDGIVEKILAYAASEEFGSGDYVDNVRAALTEPVTPNRLGLVVSLPQSWIRHTEAEVARAKDAEERVNEYVGNVKDRFEVTVTVKAVRFIESDFGVTTLYTMLDTEGHAFKWFASRDALGEEPGGTFKIKGTVKKHDEYQGMKSTVLTRCTVIEEVAV